MVFFWFFKKTINVTPLQLFSKKWLQILQKDPPGYLCLKSIPLSRNISIIDKICRRIARSFPEWSGPPLPPIDFFNGWFGIWSVHSRTGPWCTGPGADIGRTGPSVTGFNRPGRFVSYQVFRGQVKKNKVKIWHLWAMIRVLSFFSQWKVHQYLEKLSLSLTFAGLRWKFSKSQTQARPPS